MRIELPSGTPAILTVPDGDARRGVVIAADIGGLRPLFDELGGRLAAERSWATCIVEPFPGQEHLDLPKKLEAVRTLDDDRQVGDLVAAAEVLGGRGVGPVGVLGFCMGGMYAMKAATTGRFDKAVSFYGMIKVPEQWQAPGQGEPLDAVRSPQACPVLALVGGRDTWTPAADIDELEASGATVVRYPEAEHGFAHDPNRPAHRPDDAADAWRRAYEFLDA